MVASLTGPRQNLSAFARYQPWTSQTAVLAGPRDRFVANAMDAGATPMGGPQLLPVPDTRQAFSFSCGAGALQAVLMYYGDEYLESELMERLGTTSEGTNPRDIVRVARDLGYRAELRENLTLEDLEASLERKVPVIIAAQAWRGEEDEGKPWSELWDHGHYMVVVGLDRDNVYFEDPSLLGSRGKIPRAEFLERWHDIDEKPYVRSGIFISGRQPAPAPPFIYVE